MSTHQAVLPVSSELQARCPQLLLVLVDLVCLSPGGAQVAMLTTTFEELVGPMLGMLREWTVSLRSQGARMLLALLLRVGSAAQPRLVPLLAALRSAAGERLKLQETGT